MAIGLYSLWLLTSVVHQVPWTLPFPLGFTSESFSAMANLFLCFLIFPLIMSTIRGDLGTAALLNPPYLPNACDIDLSQFPADNMFAAAGEGLWDNGAACGRQYLVRCTSAAAPGACIPGQTIKVTIVDNARTLTSRPSKQGTLMFISRTGYNAIATSSPESINIDFKLFS